MTAADFKLSQDEMQLINLYRRANRRERNIVHAYMNEFLQKKKPIVRLVEAYRKVDDSTQTSVMLLLENCAQRDILKRPKPKQPALRLIAGGAA